MAERITAIEALKHFEASLASEPEKARDEVPVVEKFIAFLGNDRQMGSVATSDVVQYAREHLDRTPEGPAGAMPPRSWVVTPTT